MTTASVGLAKALGRSASGDTIALAEMSAEDLIANMSDDQRMALAAKLVPDASAAKPTDPEADPNEKEPDGDPDDTEGKKKPAMQVDGAEASGVPLKTNASVHERVKAVATAVATDDGCKGKASLALSLLADDEFAGLSATAIIKLVAQGASVSAQAADPEGAALTEMKAALARQTNSNIESGSPAKPNAKAAIDAGWDKARADANPSLFAKKVN